MKRTDRWLLACALLCCSCARPALPAAEPGALGLDATVLRELDVAFSALVDSGRVNGVYAVIARHGQIGYERTFGYRDRERGERLRRNDVFRIYSMTKPVVAVGVMLLVDQGRIGLDDPIEKYLPAFASTKVYAGGSADAPVLEAQTSPITVRQLLNHTSGLPYGLTRSPADSIFARAQLYHAARPLAEFTDALATMPLLFQPGERWSYSSGLDVAGRLIEAVSGQTLDRFLEEQIFEPLDMKHTGFRIRPEWRDRMTTVYARDSTRALVPLVEDGLLAMFEPNARFLWGSGGLLSTPDDFLRFAHMLLNGGSGVLSPESVALMTHNSLPAALTPMSYGSVNDGTYGFGLGLAVRVDSAGAVRPGPVGIYRWSGYLGTYFWVDPVHDLVAMVWTQLSPGSAAPTEARLQALVYQALQR